jgi:hypothetical protein
MRHLILYTLLLIASYATAQVPGYQGLRFSVKYDCGINHPAIVGRTGKMPMIYHNASIDYVVGRAWSIGVQYGFMTTNPYVNKNVINNAQDNGYYSVYSTDYNFKDYKGRYTQHIVAIMAKKFFKRKGYLAPVGRYLTFGAYYQLATNHFVQPVNVNSSNMSSQYVPKGFKTTSQWGGISAGLGRNFVVANRILFDLGFTVNVALPSPDAIGQNGEIDKAAYSELLLRNLFQLHLGIGVLAF